MVNKVDYFLSLMIFGTSYSSLDLGEVIYNFLISLAIGGIGLYILYKIKNKYKEGHIN